MVELEVIVWIISSIEEGDAKRSKTWKRRRQGRNGNAGGRTTVLSIPLFHIAKPLCELLDGDILIVLQQMFLRDRPRIVDERIGIRGDPGDTANHVSVLDPGISGGEMERGGDERTS